MKPIHETTYVRQLDTDLQQGKGYPSHTLMEIAGLQIAQDLKKRYAGRSFCICVGGSNNGGDGLVIARWLALWQEQVSVVLVQHPKTKDCITNYNLLPSSISIVDMSQTIHPSSMPKAEIYVDAILGTGQSGVLKQHTSEFIDLLQHTVHNHPSTILISIDVPSGYHPTTCANLHPAMQNSKQSVELQVGLRPNICYSIGQLQPIAFHSILALEVREIDIGLHPQYIYESIHTNHPVGYLLEEQDILQNLPHHKNHVAKWDKGHVVIMAKKGAAILAAKAALCTGVGLVSIACPKEEWVYLSSLPPEVQLIEYHHINPNRHNAIICGPNFGFADIETQIFLKLWNTFPHPMLADADAIHLLAKHREQISPSKTNRILTPHIAEASALLQTSIFAIQQTPYIHLEKLQQWGLCLLKGAYTKISHHPFYIVPFASNKLAFAGSGDILSGLIGGYLAQQITPLSALQMATYIHAYAGIQLPSPYSASSYLAHLPTIYGKLHHQQSNHGLPHNMHFFE